MERCYHHPFSVTRARIHGDPKQRPQPSKSDAPQERSYMEWYGWHHAEDNTKEIATFVRGANLDPKKPAPPALWRPQLAEPPAPQIKTLDDAFSHLSALLG